MNLLFTLYTVIHLTNPFVGASGSASVARSIMQQPTAAVINQVGASVSGSFIPDSTSGKEQQPTSLKASPSSIQIPAQTAVQPADAPAQQPGYIETCPDGTPAQGSCETPWGSK